MNTVLYFLRETFTNLKRSKLLTMVSVLTSGVLLSFLLALSLVIFNVHTWVSGSENQAQISVFFDTQIPIEYEQKLTDSINYLLNPQSYRFISREQSLENFQNIYGSDMLLAVEGNPFSAVLELSFSAELSDTQLDSIATKIEQISGVETVTYSSEWLEILQNFRNTVSNALSILAIVMILVVFFTIMNTIKLTVYAREDIIRNMQYVGASGWYIKTPFILEGVLQGAIAGLIAVAVIFPLRFIASDFEIYWGGVQLLTGIVIFGGFLGFWGSWFAVKKFFKI